MSGAAGSAARIAAQAASSVAICGARLGRGVAVAEATGLGDAVTAASVGEGDAGSVIGVVHAVSAMARAATCRSTASGYALRIETFHFGAIAT